jgi:protoporphyrinogen oxidase/peptidoglycan/xylan/chitin deacetylase (PgdA/CDA1 family)
MSTGNRWGIVGGGMLGLTLADLLARRGDSATVFEAAPSFGGLAGAWTLGDVTWDRHYHVTLLSDTRLRALLARLDLESEIEWKETKTGCYADGQVYPVSDVVEFLRFPALRLVDKLRLGGTIFYGSKVRDPRRLEDVPVERWLARWSGRRTFDRFWLPLLRAKLGDSYRDASAAFMWATIRRLSAARRTGLKKEMFGYVPGGYARITDRFVDVLTREGVELRPGSAVESITSEGGEVRVALRDGTIHTFDRVVVTVNASLASRMIAGLSEGERAILRDIRYQGIVCASVLLEHPLSPYYLTYLTDPAPFTAVVEMSTLVDRRFFNGRSLVYLPKYCLPSDPIAGMADEEIQDEFLGALARIYPSFRPQDVASFRVSRVREVFAIPTLGYSRRVPPFVTSVPDVYLVTSAQIVNGTLNVNETVQLAERALPEIASERPRVTTVLTSAAPGRQRPLATLSLDLDDLWSYLKTHGDDSWRTFPSFLDLVVPRILRFFDERAQSLTCFVVGKDAAERTNRPLLGSIAEQGHEIGNHSYLHDPGLHRYPAERVDDDLGRAHDAIAEATGRRPEGFRGPGYSVSADILETLQRQGYRYDASTIPMVVGPLARAWYFRHSNMTPHQRAEREDLYGSVRDGFRPLRPYRWLLEGDGPIEVPVTTMPFIRTPIHMSYLLALAERSPKLALGYFGAAVRLCRWTGVAPSLLLHSHDFLGRGDVPAMSFFPGSGLSAEVKQRFIGRCLELLGRDFDLVPIRTFVADLGDLPVRTPDFARNARRAPLARATRPRVGERP